LLISFGVCDPHANALDGNNDVKYVAVFLHGT